MLRSDRADDDCGHLRHETRPRLASLRRRQQGSSQRQNRRIRRQGHLGPRGALRIHPHGTPAHRRVAQQEQLTTTTSINTSTFTPQPSTRPRITPRRHRPQPLAIQNTTKESCPHIPNHRPRPPASTSASELAGPKNRMNPIPAQSPRMPHPANPTH